MQLPWVGRWTLLACLAAAGPAWAEDVPLRVVVVPKVTADGQTRDAGPLEAWVHDALRESGHRVVDLDASLRAQSYALSDAVANGQVPEELTVLNADAAWSVQLACERDAGNPQALGLTYYCTLTRKVVRISQGDTVYSAGVDWHDIFGSNFGQALFGGNVKKRAPALISEDLGTWTAQWTAAEGPWDVDLKLSGLGDRSQAEALAKRIGSLPGVTGARLLAFNTGVSQVAIRGEGSSALASLGDALEGDPALGLVVTHQVDRLLHARLDVARMHRRGVRLQVVPPSDAAPKSEAAIIGARADSLVQSAMSNLSWASIEEVGRRSPLEAAKKAGEPYVAVVTLNAGKSGGQDQWVVTAALASTADGKDIVLGTGRNADPLVALNMAVDSLDASFLDAAADKGRRPSLGLPADLGAELTRETVTLDDLSLNPYFPARAAHAKQAGLGSLVVTNTGEAAIDTGTVKVRAGDVVIASATVEGVPAAGGAEIALPLDQVLELDPTVQHTVPVEVVFSWEASGAFGRSRAFTSWVVHHRNTVDWNLAESVVSFVDPGDGGLRALSSAALSAAPEAEGATRELVRAAQLYSTLWGRPLQYVPDPVQTSFADSIDTVQHPRQTLSSLAGDCDDLTVLLASLFESVGLPTVILTTPGHVLLGVDSGLRAGGEILVGKQASDFVEVDGGLFIPIEATALDADFSEAWKLGAELLASAGSYEAMRTRDAWRSFPTLSLADAPEVALQMRAEASVPALPALAVPGEVPDGADAVAGPAIEWMVGSRKNGVKDALALCEEGVGESCFNLAIMLSAQSRGKGSDETVAQLERALVLLPAPVMQMVLDDWGGGRADEKGDSEAEAEAETQRRLEEILKKARENQEKLEGEGVTDVALDSSTMAGRKGGPVTEADALAPMFFYRPVQAD